VRANPSNAFRTRGRSGLLVAVALTVVGALGVLVWMVDRAAEARRVTQALAPWADAPLPSRGDSIDARLAELGATVFERHCAACHAVTGEPKIGPSLAGVTLRREPAWIRAMVLRPDSMTRDDPVASALRQAIGVQMRVVGDVGPEHARAVLEFLRRVDARTTP
jgi:mono/diheme cytochrome c family protein